MKKLTAKVLAVAVTACLTACSTMQEINRDVKTTNSTYASETQRLLNERQVAHASARTGPIVSDLPYVDATAITHDVRLPEFFKRQVTLNEPLGASVAQVISKVEKAVGVRVAYDSGLANGASQAPSSEPLAPPVQSGDSTMTSLPPPPTAVASLPLEAMRTDLAINYSGSASGLLDKVAAAMGGQWKWDATSNRVKIFKYTTETFRIAMVPGGSKSSASVGGQAAGGGGGAQNNSSTAKAETEFSTTDQLSIWKGLEETVKQLLSPAGTVTMSEAMGTITVRDVWDRVDAIREQINRVNASLTRQVEVDVRVYRLRTARSDTRALNWNIVFNALQTNAGYGFNLMTPRPDTTGQGVSSAVVTVPERDPQGNPWRYGGSSAFLDALSKLGDASVMTSTSVQTINNQPAPVNIVTRTKYLATTAPLYTAAAGSAVGAGATLTPDEIETGFKMQILPHVQDDGKRVLLQVMLSLSTLDAMNEATSGGQTIQLPQVSSREFMQRVWLTNGETLVLAGFENVDSNSDTSSPFDKSIWALGGSRGVKKSKESIVVVITPAVSAAQSNM